VVEQDQQQVEIMEQLTLEVVVDLAVDQDLVMIQVVAVQVLL
jgi:hypothetical protein|tara:strand:+ start:261 stop:386 length:126 start_codon:yes stop_codon:yes gene_type:complete